MSSGRPWTLLCHDLDLVARLDAVAGSEAVHDAETVNWAIMDCHPGGEPLDRVILADGHHVNPQRLRRARLCEAHAAEAHDRVVEGLVDVGRQLLRCEDEAI